MDDGKLVSIAAHEQVHMFEIKLSQGAKPGKGGILPAEKVTREIAEIRGIREGCASISPNRHPDISNDEDLLNMLLHVRKLTGKPVGFKTVIGHKHWLDELFSLIREKGMAYAPDFITLDGAEGGTGASPMPLIDAVGLPLKESLPLLVDKLNEYGLRERIRVIASGKLINPSDVTWALCMGADFIVSARGFMFTLGCIQALQCNKNTCPTGITTHDRKLQRGLDPELKSTRVASYVKNMIYEVGMIAHACGISSPREFRRHHARVVQENGLSLPLQACLRPRDRFWDIPVPKIDSAFDNLLVPQPSWSPSTTQQLRKLVAAPYLAPNDWTPRSEAYFVFPLAQGTPGKQCGLAATGVYQPSLRSPWLAADELFPPTIPADGEQ